MQYHGRGKGQGPEKNTESEISSFVGTSGDIKPEHRTKCGLETRRIVSAIPKEK